MATSVVFNGVTYSVPAANEEGWQALSTYLIALAGASVSGGSQSLAVRVATTATVTAATSDAIILINRAGAVTVNLPAGVDKQVLWIGDISGAAETNNITINRNGSNTIFGGTSYVLNQNNQVACFIFSSANGNWNRIAESKLPANGAANTVLASDGTKLTYRTIVNADINASAAIARSKLASGSANHVIINDGSGVLTSEAQLAVSRGGTGVSTSTGSGSVVLSNSPTLVTPNLGTPSALVLTNAIGTPTSIGLANGTGLPIDGGTTGTLPIARGGTGLTALGTSLQFLRVNAGATALEYATVSGLGDVIGPSGGVVDNEIVLFSSTTGKAIKGAGGALTLSTGLTIGGSNGVVLTAADSTGAGSIRLRSNNASASARDWGFLLDANTIGGLDLYVSLTKNGNPNAGINILTITSSLLRVVDIQTQFARNTNQIILGTTNTTTINSTAPSASRVYTIPDAGADTNFIMGAGTNTIAGTLTLPATVNYTSNGSIVKSGNHALTLVTSGTSNATFPTGTFTLAILGANTFTAAQTITAASNQIVLSSGVNQLTLNSSTSAAARVYSFPDVGTTGTVAMLEGAQTFSALKTFSSGLNVSGGSAANGSIWFASNVLRQRGGTSGWAVDNTSGTAIISATDAGAVTVSAGSATNAGIGARFNASNAPAVLSYFCTNGNPYVGFNTVQTAASDNQTYAVTNIASRIVGFSGGNNLSIDVAASGTAGNTITWVNALTATNAGAVTLGPSSGFTGFHITQGQAVAANVIHRYNKTAVAGGTNSSYFVSFGHGATDEGYVWHDNTGNMAFANASDRRLKENIREITGLDKCLALHPVMFDWKDGTGSDNLGFIAQEVEQVMPKSVGIAPDGSTKVLSMQSEIIPVLVKAIQELHAELQELKGAR